jgi:hypothetical protein
MLELWDGTKTNVKQVNNSCRPTQTKQVVNSKVGPLLVHEQTMDKHKLIKFTMART